MTFDELLRRLETPEDRNRLRLLVGSFEQGRDVLEERGGGAAIVVWLEDGTPFVLATSEARFAITIARWMSATRLPIESAPATPRNHGGRVR